MFAALTTRLLPNPLCALCLALPLTQDAARDARIELLTRMPDDSLLFVRLDTEALARSILASEFGRWMQSDALAPFRVRVGPFLAGVPAVLERDLPVPGLAELAEQRGTIEFAVRGANIELGENRFAVRRGSPVGASLVQAITSWSRDARRAPEAELVPPEPLRIELDAVLRMPLSAEHDIGPLARAPWVTGSRSTVELDGRSVLCVDLDLGHPALSIPLYESVVGDEVWWSGSLETLRDCLDATPIPVADLPTVGSVLARDDPNLALAMVDVSGLLSLARPLLFTSGESVGSRQVAPQLTLTASSSERNGVFLQRLALRSEGGESDLLADLCRPSTAPAIGSPRLGTLLRAPADTTVFCGIAADLRPALRELAEAVDAAVGDGGALRRTLLAKAGLDSLETWITLEAFGREHAVLITTQRGLFPDGVALGRVDVRATYEAMIESLADAWALDLVPPSKLDEGMGGRRFAVPNTAFALDVVWNDDEYWVGPAISLRRWQREIGRVTPEGSLYRSDRLQRALAALELGAGERVPFLVHADCAALVSTLGATVSGVLGVSALGDTPWFPPLHELDALPEFTFALHQREDGLDILVEEPIPGSLMAIPLLFGLAFAESARVERPDG